MPGVVSGKMIALKGVVQNFGRKNLFFKSDRVLFVRGKSFYLFHLVCPISALCQS